MAFPLQSKNGGEMIIIQAFRPDEIIQGYWKEILNITETDELLPVETLMKKAA